MPSDLDARIDVAAEQLQRCLSPMKSVAQVRAEFIQGLKNDPLRSGLTFEELVELHAKDVR